MICDIPTVRDPSIPDSFTPNNLLIQFVGVLPFESGTEEVNLKTEEERSGCDDSRTEVVRYCRGARGIRNDNSFTHSFPIKINFQGCLGHKQVMVALSR